MCVCLCASVWFNICDIAGLAFTDKQGMPIRNKNVNANREDNNASNFSQCLPRAVSLRTGWTEEDKNASKLKRSQKDGRGLHPGDTQKKVLRLVPRPPHYDLQDSPIRPRIKMGVDPRWGTPEIKPFFIFCLSYVVSRGCDIVLAGNVNWSYVASRVRI